MYCKVSVGIIRGGQEIVDEERDTIPENRPIYNKTIEDALCYKSETRRIHNAPKNSKGLQNIHEFLPWKNGK